MQKFAFNLDQPLFILDDYTLLTQSALRRRLATLLRMMNIPLVGFGFHTFRRSGASIAYDANVPLSTIKMHGAWAKRCGLGIHLCRHIPNSQNSSCLSNTRQRPTINAVYWGLGAVFILPSASILYCHDIIANLLHLIKVEAPFLVCM